ncbi:hypothetical protein BC939DRAFT_436151 [Gamsiella multidivaricata]|uniref:uncharacterized protein n=1 Tax=Gamsiella multidivaricata TaxID=101098 RepID=UPI00221EF6BD|nr:uncharacterized protein BC939DRAFT_436151 [Gamsiella multidivaricata]KAI7831710.1 hypothetical protein BC939DRAFT_436151 [Gamsiella multidivaricata]
MTRLDRVSWLRLAVAMLDGLNRLGFDRLNRLALASDGISTLLQITLDVSFLLRLAGVGSRLRLAVVGLAMSGLAMGRLDMVGRRLSLAVVTMGVSMLFGLV